MTTGIYNSLQDMINALEGAYSELKGLESVNRRLNKEELESMRENFVEIREIITRIITNPEFINKIATYTQNYTIQVYENMLRFYTSIMNDLELYLVFNSIFSNSIDARVIITAFMGKFVLFLTLLKTVVGYK